MLRALQMMKLFMTCILFCITPLAWCDIHEDYRVLRLVKNKIQSQIETILEHQAKQNNCILELEQINRFRELEHDDRIRELERTIQMQSIQIQDVHRECIQSKKGTTGFRENSALPLLQKNTTVFKTFEDSMDITSMEKVHIGMDYLNGRRHEKKDSLGRQNDRKRLLLNTDSSSTVAFYAYMNSDETNPGRHQTLIFDEVKTNIGSAYNKHSGLFISPNHGIYVFTWTIVADVHGYIYSEIMTNSTPFGSILTNSQEINDDHTVTGIVVAEVNQGDVVYIRTNPNASIQGKISSDTLHRTSFSGWKLN